MICQEMSFFFFFLDENQISPLAFLHVFISCILKNPRQKICCLNLFFKEGRNIKFMYELFNNSYICFETKNCVQSSDFHLYKFYCVSRNRNFRNPLPVFTCKDKLLNKLHFKTYFDVKPFHAQP